MAENIEEIKAHLKKAIELESALYTYQKVNEEMDYSLSHIPDEAYQKVDGYQYGEAIPVEYAYLTSLPQERLQGCFALNEMEQFRYGNRKFELPTKESRSKAGMLVGSVLVGVLGSVFITFVISLVYSAIFRPWFEFNTIMFFILAAIFGILNFVGGLSGLKEAEGRYNAKMELYNYILQDRNRKIANERAQIRYCQNTKAAIPPMEEKVRKTLEKHYSLGVIYPKYRNFVAVAQIYEYLDSGRCDSLAGPNGAYNLFEQEMRANIIIVQLDRIYNKLEEIRQMQVMIYNTLCSIQRLLGGIQSELSNLTDAVYDNTAAINRFNAQVNSYLY